MEQNYKQHPDGCMCMMCHGGRHRLLRWILGIIILVIVFCFGVKVGEFKTALGYYGYGMWPGMMENSYYGSAQYPYGYMPMMGGYYGAQGAASSQSAPAATQNSYYGPGGMMRGYYQNTPQATSTK